MLGNGVGSIDSVDPETAEKLEVAGFTTIESIAMTPPQEIAEKTGIPVEKVLKIQKAAWEKVSEKSFMNAEEAYLLRKSVGKCTTGSRELDRLLGGGVQTRAVTEFIGEYRSGKSQICLTLCVTAQQPPEEGGLGGNVVYIDAEGTFFPERVYQIASQRGLDPSQIIGNITTARAYNSDHQCLLIDRLFKKCKEENVKLVVVDNMISHFRSEYTGMEQIAERQRKLNQYLHKLVRLADAYNLAVVVTNQVQGNLESFYGDPDKPAGGHITAHASIHRIHLRKGEGETRTATVISSPTLPRKRLRFMVTDKGIEDVPEDYPRDT